MNAIVKNWVNIVHKRFDFFYQLYQQHPGMILTEGDLECHMFNSILAEPCFHEFKKTKDENTTIALHSQVTWFKNQELAAGYRVDLTVCDPTKLHIQWMHTVEDYPNKGFYYYEKSPALAIELKFIRDFREQKCKEKAVEDYIYFMDKFLDSYLDILEHKFYHERDLSNIACITIIGCKNEDIFNIAKAELTNFIRANLKHQEYIFPILFSPTSKCFRSELI